MCGIGNVHAGFIHLHLQHMKIKAGLHLLFTREVLAEIPAVTLAITSPWVTSFSIKGVSGVRDGRCGWYGNVMGGERERKRQCAACCNRIQQANVSWAFLGGSVVEFLTGVFKHKTFIHTHTHTSTLPHLKKVPFSFLYFFFLFVSLKAVTEARLLLKGVHVQASMKSGVRVRVHVCAFLLQSESPSQQ